MKQRITALAIVGASLLSGSMVATAAFPAVAGAKTPGVEAARKRKQKKPTAKQKTNAAKLANTVKAKFANDAKRSWFENIAAALNISGAELRADLASGMTVAQVADAQGLDPQLVIDVLVAQATSYLDSQVANGNITADQEAQLLVKVADRVTKMVFGESPDTPPGNTGGGNGGGSNGGSNGGGSPGGPGDHHHGHAGDTPPPGHFNDWLPAVAAALGISPEQLETALAGGTSIARLAADLSVDLGGVIEGLMSQAQQRLDRLVADGRMTQAQEDQILAGVRAAITALVNDSTPLDGRHD